MGNFGALSKTKDRTSFKDLGMVNIRQMTLPPAIAAQNPFGGMVKDPETGYLIPGKLLGKEETGSSSFFFTPDKKALFIKLASKYFPNIMKVCREVGVSKDTYTAHFKIDEKFRNEMEEIKREKVDAVEENVFHFSGFRQNFMDRIAILRAYRGELYNPQSVMTIRHEISQAESEVWRAALATVVDAEIVNSSAEVLAMEAETPEISMQDTESIGTLGSSETAEPVQSPSGGKDNDVNDGTGTNLAGAV